MASIMAMLQGMGGQQAPMQNPGAATPPTGAGFGLGQQLVQPPAVPGQDAQMAGNPGGGLAGMMGQATDAMQDPQKRMQLMQMMQMMQAQGQGQGQMPMGGGMAGMMGGARPQMGQTQASRGYLSSGGGLAKAQY